MFSFWKQEGIVLTGNLCHGFRRKGKTEYFVCICSFSTPPPAQNNPYAKAVYFRAGVLVSSNVLVKLKIMMKGPTGEGFMFGLKANTFFFFFPRANEFLPLWSFFEAGSHWVAQAAWNSLCSTGWPWTLGPPASADWTLALQMCATGLGKGWEV